MHQGQPVIVGRSFVRHKIMCAHFYYSIDDF